MFLACPQSPKRLLVVTPYQWELPGLAKEELQKMEDRARRGEKETVRKPREWLPHF